MREQQHTAAVRPRLRKAALLVLSAAALAAVESVQDHLHATAFPGRDSFGIRLANTLAPWLIIALLVPAIGGVVRRWPLNLRRLWAHLIAACAFAVAHFTLLDAYAVVRWWPRHHFARGLRDLLGYHFVFDVLVYFVIAGAMQAAANAVAARTRKAETLQLEARVAQARLSALRAQLNPHFLYNVLNTAAMLAREDRGAEVVSVLRRLSGLLGYVLTGRAEDAPLGEELAFLRGYLELEQVRF